MLVSPSRQALPDLKAAVLNFLQLHAQCKPHQVAIAVGIDKQTAQRTLYTLLSENKASEFPCMSVTNKHNPSALLQAQVLFTVNQDGVRSKPRWSVAPTSSGAEDAKRVQSIRTEARKAHDAHVSSTQASTSTTCLSTQQDSPTPVRKESVQLPRQVSCESAQPTPLSSTAFFKQAMHELSGSHIPMFSYLCMSTARVCPRHYRGWKRHCILGSTYINCVSLRFAMPSTIIMACVRLRIRGLCFSTVPFAAFRLCRPRKQGQRRSRH